MVNRRRFIVGITVTSTASLAGCSGNGASTDDNEPTTDSESDGVSSDASGSDTGDNTDNSESDDTSSDASSSDTGDNTDTVSDGQGGPDPEAAVERYLTARINGNQAAVDAVLYPESPLAEIESDEPAEITITEIAEVSPRELVERRFDESASESDIQATVEETQNQLAAIQDELGVADAAIVVASWMTDDTDRTQQYTVVEDGGRWFVYTA